MGDLTWVGIYDKICYRNCEIYIVYEIIYDFFIKLISHNKDLDLNQYTYKISFLFYYCYRLSFMREIKDVENNYLLWETQDLWQNLIYIWDNGRRRYELMLILNKTKCNYYEK